MLIDTAPLPDAGRRRLLSGASATALSLGLAGCGRPVRPGLGPLIERCAPAVLGVGDASGVAGSGFRVAGSSLVVTAAHVLRSLQGPLQVRVGGRIVEARLHRLDEEADLALLRAEGDGLQHTLPLADALPVTGQWVVVLGCPFGTLPTATIGIVSALPGAVLEPTALKRRLQLNAAVNPGNSGGPVIDLSGRVIGVANATVPGGYGLGFAVPAHDVRALLEVSRTGPGS